MTPLTPSRWLAGFFEVDAPQSMTRLCALLLSLAAVIAVVLAAWKGKLDAGAAAVVTALIGGGVVALLVRSKSDTTKPGGDA